MGKFWGSGEGAGGGLNFTLSDLQGDLERVGAKLEFLPSRETVETAVQAAQTTAQLDVNEPELNCVKRIQQQDEQHEREASEQAVHAGSMPEAELGYLERQQPVLDCVGRDQQHRQSEKVFEREKLKDNDPEQQAQWQKVQAQRMQALGIAGAEEARKAAELAGQETQQQAVRHRNEELATG